MSKFHISDGRVMPCKAKEGECPLGGEHYSSRDEADIVAERINIEKYGLLGVDNQTKDQARLDGNKIITDKKDMLNIIGDWTTRDITGTYNAGATTMTASYKGKSYQFNSDNIKDVAYIAYECGVIGLQQYRNITVVQEELDTVN